MSIFHKLIPNAGNVDHINDNTLERRTERERERVREGVIIERRGSE